MTTTVDGTPVVVPLCRSDVAEYLADDLASQVAGGTNVMLYPDTIAFERWGDTLHALLRRSATDRRFKIVIYNGHVTILSPRENLDLT